MKNNNNETAEALISALKGCDICAKKMFGCCCIYFDKQPVGWASGDVFWLKNTEINDLCEIEELQQYKGNKQIPINKELFTSAWFKNIITKTAAAVEMKKTNIQRVPSTESKG
ncbi:hypothetical protein E4N95_01135 [Treponema denticola]|uniref:hypothetical protein n=1 Tax=Treponema denticola TaxID=158 RepID=UPI003D8CE23F